MGRAIAISVGTTAMEFWSEGKDNIDYRMDKWEFIAEEWGWGQWVENY